jgi:hypothetical protein
MEIRVRMFKKVMLVTTAISSIGMTGAGVAQAHDGGDSPDVAIDNAQFLHCEQEFDAGSLLTVNAPVTVLGESVTNIGNFCTQVAAE